MKSLIVPILLSGCLLFGFSSCQKKVILPGTTGPDTSQPGMNPNKVPGKRKKNKRMVIGKNPQKDRDKFVKNRRKENIKTARELKKPQYSDPMYFGHKKPPKKRPPGKQKHCKECGMKH